jgi:septal ring factor EnvC (AmiA/AmiB activator)
MATKTKRSPRAQIAALKRELADVRGAFRALQDDYDVLREDHSESVDQRARLTAELERLRGGLRLYLQRCEREIRDHKARANFRADWANDIGTEGE